MPESPIVYYTSTSPVFGKMTLKQYIETDVEERGNFTLAYVQNWMRKYNLSGNDLAIWVSPRKWVANMYNLRADERDEAEKIPESEMDVYEIKGNEGFIIPETDDGDEGYLFVFKKIMNHVIRESGNQGTATARFDSYLNTLSPMTAGTTKKVMAQLIRLSDGTIISRREWIEKKASCGGKIGTSKTRLRNKEEELERQIEIMKRDVPANENHPTYKRYMEMVSELKKGIFKEELHIEMPDGKMNTVSKTEADYFNFLQGLSGDFSLKKAQELIREGTQGTVPGQQEKINKIIEDVKKKPFSAPEKRDEIRRELTALAGSIDQSAITELRNFRPLGMMSELGAAMGAEPRKGVKIDTPFGPYVFDDKRIPSKERVDRWFAQHKEADGIRTIAVVYSFGLGASPMTVTGNFRVVERGRRFKEQGMLSPEEEQALNALEKYWQDHPDLDRQKGYGIWGHNLDIMVPESLLRKNMTEKKGSLIDALLRIEPGKDIRIDYNDVPKGVDMVSLPSYFLTPEYPTLRGIVVERRGDLLVAAIQSDREIVAFLYVQKGSQLIQIRPIPRQKTPTKEGEVNTIEYNKWVERIKKEAPEYLPEWEITTAGIRAGDTITHKTAKYTAVVDKVYKNGNADITVTEAKIYPEWEKSINEGFPVKLHVKDLEMYFEKAAIKGTETKQPWEMTRSEAIAEAAKPLGPMGISWGEMRTALSTGRKFAESLHKDMVKLAIFERKPVPPEVLKEYPDLIKKEKEILRGTGMAEQYEEKPPTPEVRDWMKRALGIEDYKGIRHDRISMLALLIQNSELGNIRSINEAGQMARALGKDLEYGEPPAYGKSQERYYGEKIAAETGREVHIIKSSDIIKPTAKEPDVHAIFDRYTKGYGKLSFKVVTYLSDLKLALEIQQVVPEISAEGAKRLAPTIRSMAEKKYSELEEQELKPLVESGAIAGGTPARQILTVPEPEGYYFGTKVEVLQGADPDLEPYFTGTVKRLLNKGELVEVHPDGDPREVSFRVPVDRVNVTGLVTPEAPKKMYRYYYLHRPPGIGTQPERFIGYNSWLPAATTPHGRKAFGWVEYDRPLTPEEMSEYELFEDEVELPKLVKELVQFARDEGIDEVMKAIDATYGRAVWDWLKSQKRLRTGVGQKEQVRAEIARLAGITDVPAKTQFDPEKLHITEKAKLFLTALKKYNTPEELAQQKAAVERLAEQVPELAKELIDTYEERYYFLKSRGKPAKEVLTEKDPEDYYLGTEVTVEPESGKPYDATIKRLLNNGTVAEVNPKGTAPEVSIRINIERVYVFGLKTRPLNTEELRKKYSTKAQPGIEKINPEQAIKIAADSIEQLRRVDVFRVLDQYKENSIEIGNYIKSNRPDLVAEVDKILGEFQPKPKDKFAEIQDQMQRDKDKIMGEYLRDLAWKMTSKEFINEALKLNKYREKYEKDPRLMNEFTSSGIQKWKELVEKHGEVGKLPDKVIEDYIQLFGEQALFSVFRGTKAKGIEGWRIPAVPPAAPPAETPDQLYAKLFSGWSALSKGAQAEVSDKDMIYFISTELKIPPEKASKLSWIFKQKLQDDYKEAMSKAKAEKEIKKAEEEKQAKVNELKFWDEVKNLKVVDYEVQHDINPDKPTRTYYHVYDRTFAILENGKKVQVSYVINKGVEGQRAAKAPKEFYMKFYGQYMGKPLSEWITYDQLMTGNRYEDYKAQKPGPRVTFIPEAPQAAPPAIQPSQGIQARYNAYVSSTVLQTGALASPKFLSDERMAEDIERNIQVSIDEARSLVPQFRAIAEKMINKDMVESVKELFGIDVEQKAHDLGIDLKDYAIVPAGNKVVLQHKTTVQRRYDLQPPAGFIKKTEEEIQERLRKAEERYSYRLKYGMEPLHIEPEAKKEPVPPGAKPAQSIQEIKQQVLDSIQAARTVEELQPVLKGIGFLPLPEPEKRQVTEAYQNRYSILMSERPFGVPVKGEEKPKAIGALTPQQLFEADLRRKAAESRTVSVTPTLTGGAVTARRLEMFEPGAMEKVKAEAETRKRIEQLGLPYEVHPLIKKLAAGTQDVMKFGSKRGRETVEDIVLTRYVKYCPPGSIIDNRSMPKVPERWWVYPPKLRACMGDIEKKLAEAGAGMVRESQRYRYCIYQDGRLFANENHPVEAQNIYDMLVRTYPKSVVELRENFVHPRIHQRTLKQYPVSMEISVVREATQLTQSMRSYIRGAVAVRDVIHYYRDGRTPTRGVAYRARDGTYFVEAHDGQVYASMGWEEIKAQPQGIRGAGGYARAARGYG